ncbi:SPOR domain-containing protein [Verminephrobacter eiseniae]|uniref:SPOR domain-containing protein n=1 Tax=Verminephrobacter eiseniae TaxID=364317 RepID=UPI0022370EDF|nr:SPOR domain-containing protein [Verminephrobacter eiseniae]MCW5237897.1 SPOR domain-containing protein [Verminephrobacter eiseniae]
MLRLAVILLLLANAGYRAWSQGLLRPWGLAPEAQTEPQRMHQQIRPETLQILQPGPGTSAPPPTAQPAAASTASGQTPDASAECLRAGVFDEQQADALRTAAAGLPSGSWALEPSLMPGRWMVYMGRFDDQDALDKKRTELRARKVDFDRAGGPWEPGLSLGRFSSEEAARRELQNLSGKGVRSARVIRERPESIGYTLRLPAVNDALRPQLAALRSALAGKTWRNCD